MLRDFSVKNWVCPQQFTIARSVKIVVLHFVENFPPACRSVALVPAHKSNIILKFKSIRIFSVHLPQSFIQYHLRFGIISTIEYPNSDVQLYANSVEEVSGSGKSFCVS